MSDGIKCPHCGGGESYLNALVERLETTAVQTVRCVRCGWRISRTVAPPVHPRIAPEPMKKAGRPAGRVGSVSCSVLGCQRRTTEGAPLGMCAIHRKTMRQWQESGGRYSSPFEKTPEGGYALLSRAQRRKGAG